MGVWFGGNKVEIKNQVLRLRCTVHFSCTHDGDAVSTDHRAIFDVEAPMSESMETALKQHVVKFQNGMLRKMTAEAGTKFCRDNIITKDILYPGTRRAVPREMSEAEIIAKAKADPDFAARLLAELNPES